MESTPLMIELVAGLLIIAGTIGVLTGALVYMYVKSKAKEEETIEE